MTVCVVVVTALVVVGVIALTRSGEVVPRPVAAPTPTELQVRPATSDDIPAGLQLVADPICEDHGLVYNILAARWQSFAKLDEKIPASQWTPEQRDIADATARAMLSAAAQYESMLPRAENRVIQELLAQTIVYLRANAENLPHYRAAEDVNLAYTATRLDGAILAVCAAVPLVASLSAEMIPAPRPTTVAVDPSALVPFMKLKDGICDDYVAWAQRRDEDLETWESRGGQLSVEGSQWPPEQRAIADDVSRVLARNADEVRGFAERADNPLVRDFLATAAPYNQIFAKRLPAYRLDDWPAWDVTNYLLNAVRFGCQT